MASFHLAVKTVGRSAGRSATAAAAYRAGVEIVDERTGIVHDYTRKQGIEHREIVAPADAPEWVRDRAALWNAAEQAETRKNSTVAREYEIALPAELSADERRTLTLDLAREISERHGVAVTIAETGRRPRRRCAGRWTPITGRTSIPRDLYIERIQREPQMARAVGQLLHDRALVLQRDHGLSR